MRLVLSMQIINYMSEKQLSQRKLEEYSKMARLTNSEPVQVIGTKFVMYKTNKEKPGIQLVK